MKFLLAPNFSKPNTAKVFDSAVEILKNNGSELYLSNEYSQTVKGNFTFTDEKTALSKCDTVIAIGGDGTIIDMAKKSAFFNKPVLGINSGRIGFLAGLEFEDIDNLCKIQSGEYEIETASMLEVFSKNNPKKIYYCINDAVLSRISFSKMADIELRYLNNKLSYRADGVVVATPTGSTAYSMSAGGPVVDRTVGGIIVTPICPYSYFSRSVIINDNSTIELSSLKQNENLCLIIDGEKVEGFSSDEVFCIKKSELKVRFIKIGETAMFKKLNEKIK